MANQKNRKKELRQELKRQGITGQEHPKVVRLDKETDITAIPTDAETVEIVEKPSFEEFAKNPELEGLSADKVKSLYDQGITSPEEIKNFKEEELLDIKGVGPATVEKLSETVGVDGKGSLNEFSELKEVADIRSDLVEMLYHEGITTAADFKKWSKDDLIAINGIGPATVDKLVENGAKLKK